MALWSRWESDMGIPVQYLDMTAPERGECRCCNTELRGCDHCPLCGCEELEERVDCPYAALDL